MSTSPRLRAFISGVYREFSKHRDLCDQLCRRYDIEPVRVDTAGAMATDPLQAGLALIDGCDAFIGIVGNSYGSRPGKRSLSYIELEYDRAVERGVPCYIFFQDESVLS